MALAIIVVIIATTAIMAIIAKTIKIAIKTIIATIALTKKNLTYYINYNLYTYIFFNFCIM